MFRLLARISSFSVFPTRFIRLHFLPDLFIHNDAITAMDKTFTYGIIIFPPDMSFRIECTLGIDNKSIFVATAKNLAEGI